MISQPIYIFSKIMYLILSKWFHVYLDVQNYSLVYVVFISLIAAQDSEIQLSCFILQVWKLKTFPCNKKTENHTI